MQISVVDIGKVLTRTSGYLQTVASHSLQPYRGCALGHSLCGVSCYVQHSRHITRGRTWGDFLEARQNAASSYLRHVQAERRWARRHRNEFAIFLSSATEPFPPQERRFGITRSVLEAMVEHPPDRLILQTHSHQIEGAIPLLKRLADVCDLRCHLSIETDRERVAGLPRHGSPVERRFQAARRLRDAGLFTVITVSPLLPIADPESFFRRIATSADAVVLDHFIGGDGSKHGSRTRRTRLPGVMEAVQPGSSELDYRDLMAEIAERRMPERVGISIDGFAGRNIRGNPFPRRFRGRTKAERAEGSGKIGGRPIGD